MLRRALQPLRIGPWIAPGRVVMAAMELAMHDRGEVDERYISFLTRRAGTGLAWLTTGGVAVRKDGLTSPHQLRLDDDRFVPGWDRLCRSVHRAGGQLFVQLTHAGRQTLAETIGCDPIAPSPLPCPVMRQEPRPLRADEMPGLAADFARAARRAADAGADGVELHMGHGYLLSSFLSPASNQRDDEYGGDTERRCRLPGEVIAAVKAAVGPETPVIARFSADEMVDGGIDLDEGVRIGRHLQDWGADALHVSACSYGSLVWNIPTYLLPEAGFRHLAAAVKRAVSVPVIAVGRLHTPELIEDILRSGDADLVAVGRPLIADPDYYAHLREGSAPRPCLKCNRCIQSIAYGPVTCSVNPHARGGDRPASQPRKYRRVLVVGGGPAGIATALLASQAGHSVRLLEKRTRLGGQLEVAAAGSHKAAIAGLRLHLLSELDGSTVDVQLETPLDSAQVDDFEPGCIVIATGSAPDAPDLPEGAGFAVRTVDQALASADTQSGTTVVVGAGAAGVEAAHALAARGNRVILLEKRPRIGIGLIPYVRFHALRLLSERGVETLTRVKALEPRGTALYVKMRTTDRILDNVAQLVWAVGRTPRAVDPGIYAASDAQVLAIGDALLPGSILEAMEGAHRVVEELAE